VSQDIDLKAIERNAWRSVFQDGLWDIYLGLLLLGMGSGDLVEGLGLPDAARIAVSAGLTVPAMLLLWGGKRFITTPRVGRFKLGGQAKARRMKARLLTTASVLFGLVLFLFTSYVVKVGNPFKTLDLKVFFPAVYVLNMLGVFWLGAVFLDYSRLYLIGLMFALPVPLDFFLRETMGIRLGGWAFAGPAAVVLAVGLVHFVRFLREYPLPVESAAGEEGVP
jgi:hypothetical protein